MIYLSGPMSGIHEHNFQAFNEEARRLRALGYEVKNPAEFPNKGKTWEECLRYDLGQLLECASIALLDGWQASRGAQLETYVAHALGFRILQAKNIVEAAP